MNKFYQLTPKTKRAKQLIKEHGAVWETLRQEQFVLFSTAPGPWILLVPRFGDQARNSRWVNLHNDDQFILEDATK